MIAYELPTSCYRWENHESRSSCVKQQVHVVDNNKY